MLIGLRACRLGLGWAAFTAAGTIQAPRPVEANLMVCTDGENEVCLYWLACRGGACIPRAAKGDACLDTAVHGVLSTPPQPARYETALQDAVGLLGTYTAR